MFCRLGITMGDPAGIGPEVVVRALAAVRLRHPITVFGRVAWLAATARALHVSARRLRGNAITIVECATTSSGRFRRGRPSAATGDAALACVRRAALAVEQGAVDALVTAPVSKAVIQSAGHWFPGHTEWLARRCRVSDVGMLFVGGGLRVMLVTRHAALRRVPTLLTRERLRTALRLCVEALQRDYRIRHPRIAVAGLNPHAGESGRLGTEEQRVITPTLRALRFSGARITGPIAPDAVFFDARQGRYDAVVAMYHDQGLIPFKMLARDTGVNVTLGLPFVRTAPDHGTAFDIAERFCAHPGAMLAAIRLAIQLCDTRRAGAR